MSEEEALPETMLALVVGEKPSDAAAAAAAKMVRLPVPDLDGPGFCRIRVLRAGVCNTDLEILEGYMGFAGVPGHEFVGVVQAVHDDSDRHWIGRRVCGDINVGCGECDVCRDARNLDSYCSRMSRNHCPNRTVLGILNRNGAMAEYLTLPVRNLHAVPEGVPDEVAVFAEPLAAACRIAEQGIVSYGPERFDRVAILGDGKLGLMIAEVLGREHANCDVNNRHSKPVLVGKHAHKLELVADSGVVGMLLSDCLEDGGQWKPELRGKFDVVVDATGRPAGFRLAGQLCRPMGTIVLKSTCAASDHRFNAAPLVIDELKVAGSRCGPIDQALRLLSESNGGGGNGLRVTKYITRTFPLARAVEAVQCAAEKSTMKVQIVCSESRK
jgi:alcohol dehydrogenase